MPRRRRRTFELVKHAIWLTVALGGTAYVVAHLGDLGWWGVAALAIGVSMLTSTRSNGAAPSPDTSAKSVMDERSSRSSARRRLVLPLHRAEADLTTR
jgi:hypothetical protein